MKKGDDGKKEKKRKKKRKEKRMLFLVATTSLPAVYRLNDDCWNASRLCQNHDRSVMIILTWSMYKEYNFCINVKILKSYLTVGKESQLIKSSSVHGVAPGTTNVQESILNIWTMVLSSLYNSW